ncbi:MAG: hypothetical protein E6343_03220 [Clostridium perfringens]|nr:hypothetical protein [Clostridium perfringens]
MPLFNSHFPITFSEYLPSFISLTFDASTKPLSFQSYGPLNATGDPFDITGVVLTGFIS